MTESADKKDPSTIPVNEKPRNNNFTQWELGYDDRTYNALLVVAAAMNKAKLSVFEIEKVFLDSLKPGIRVLDRTDGSQREGEKRRTTLIAITQQAQKAGSSAGEPGTQKFDSAFKAEAERLSQQIAATPLSAQRVIRRTTTIK